MRLKRFLRTLAVFSPVYLICAGATSAADTPPLAAIKCSSDWANAVAAPLNNIQNNSVGLFVAAAVPLGIIAIVAFAFLHMTRHRGTILTILLMILAAAVAIVIWPGLANSLLPSC